jgi:hypothetical protein
MSGSGDEVVVAGIDGSEGSGEVLRFAMEGALRRGVAVEVVTARRHGPPTPRFGGPTTSDDAWSEGKQRQDAGVAESCIRRGRIPVVVVPVEALLTQTEGDAVGPIPKQQGGVR